MIWSMSYSGFCESQGALSADKLWDFRSPQLLLHNLAGDGAWLKKFCSSSVHLWGNATGNFFFLTFPDKQTVSLQHSCVFWMMKRVATGLKCHLKTVPAYNLLQTEVLHHIYKVKLEAPGFREGRNTYSGRAYNDTYPVSPTVY